MAKVCSNCGDPYSASGLPGGFTNWRPCPNPSPGRPFVDCGVGNHMYDRSLDTISDVLEFASWVPDKGFTVEEHCAHAILCLARIRHIVEASAIYKGPARDVIKRTLMEHMVYEEEADSIAVQIVERLADVKRL